VLPLSRELWCKDTAWSSPGWEQFCRKGPRGHGRQELGTSPQCALAAGMANSPPRLCQQGHSQDIRGGMVSRRSALVRFHLESCV